MEPKEFKMHYAYLPSSVASKAAGNTITIRNPNRLREWLPNDSRYGKSKGREGILSRLGIRGRRRTGSI